MKVLFNLTSGDLGKGNVKIAWQKRNSNFLAVCGSNRRVQIYDRQKKLVCQFGLQTTGNVIQMEWDRDGDILAIIQADNPAVMLWNLNTQSINKVETGQHQLTFISWSLKSPLLAIGTAKGTLLLYNRKTSQMIPIKGKHTKKITGGCWNDMNSLALVGDDYQLTISDVNGETRETKRLNNETTDVQWASIKQEKAAKGNTSLSLIHGGRSLWILDTTKKFLQEPQELSFQPKYGRIRSYSWFGDGYILVAFTSGHVVVISTHAEEIGQEIASSDLHNLLSDVTYNAEIQKGASVGDNCVKVFDMSDLKAFSMNTKTADFIELESEFGSLNEVQWTDDGQILTVTSISGSVYTFLCAIPLLFSTYENRIMFMTSLRQVCVKDMIDDVITFQFDIDVEPSFISLGPNHAAVGMNNRVWYYRFGSKGVKFLGEKKYVGTVEDVKFSNNYAAVLADGKVTLQLIERRKDRKGKDQMYFPSGDTNDITSLAMTRDFLIYSTSQGSIVFFGIEDWAIVSDFRFEVGITKIFPNHLGTRFVFVDQTHSAYLYNPIDSMPIPISKFPANADTVLWDITESSTFVVADDSKLVTYVYANQSMRGARVTPVSIDKVLATTPKPKGMKPIVLIDGKVFCQSNSGNISPLTLVTHSFILDVPRENQEYFDDRFSQELKLLRFDQAWETSLKLKSRKHWEKLATKALEHVELDVAIRAYRKLKNAAVVMALEEILHIDELNVLLGMIAMIRKSFPEAESRFMKSTEKHRALEMNRDLMQWDRALRLAEQLDKKQIPLISREYAQQLELKGEYEKANELYAKALESSATKLGGRHEALCREGLARTHIRLGNFHEGKSMAIQSNSRKLCRECAQVFDELRQFNDAAVLYVKAGLYEKAAEKYIFMKNFKEVEPLLSRLENPKLFIHFAKAKESEKRYQEAERAYEKAGDFLNVVRLNLTRLNNAAKAISIVLENNSVEGAKLIADFCKEQKNYQRAIEFLVLAGQVQEAYMLACEEKEMGTYSRVIEKNGNPAEFRRIAQYYENSGNNAQAGDFYRKCKMFEKTVDLYLKCGDDKIEDAIEVVGESNDENLKKRLIRYLTGEEDGGVPKEPKYIFDLYITLGKYDDAAEIALRIALQEQSMGNYSIAKKMLFDTHQKLIAKNIRVPQDLKNSLMLLQSYLVIKELSKLKDTMLPARLLLRVTNNIGKFPHHNVPILTTTVIMCYKAGLKREAFEYASKLTAPEYRQRIEAKYKKLVYGIVRKRKGVNDDNQGEILTPCPYCSAKLPATQLSCHSCKSQLPYCLVTGRHIVVDDFTMCPSCRFPALHSYFTKLLSVNGCVCPMCEKTVDLKQVTKIKNVESVLKNFK